MTAKDSVIRFTIRTGALAPRLDRQIREQGLKASRKAIAHLQKVADAVTLLSVGGYLSDREAHRARRRLCDTIANNCSPAKERP